MGTTFDPTVMEPPRLDAPAFGATVNVRSPLPVAPGEAIAIQASLTVAVQVHVVAILTVNVPPMAATLWLPGVIVNTHDAASCVMVNA